MIRTFEVKDEEDATCLTAEVTEGCTGVRLMLDTPDECSGLVDQHLFYSFCKKVVTYYEKKGFK